MFLTAAPGILRLSSRYIYCVARLLRPPCLLPTIARPRQRMCPPRSKPKPQVGFYQWSNRTIQEAQAFPLQYSWDYLVGGRIRLVEDPDISLLASPYLTGGLSQPTAVNAKITGRYKKARTDLKKALRRTSSAKPQAQSPFLRLPEEIRCQIIEYILGNRLLHIKLYGGRKGKKFMRPCRLTCKYGEDHIADSSWNKCSTRADQPMRRSLSLLLCCKAVYVQDHTGCLALCIWYLMIGTIDTLKPYIRFTRATCSIFNTQTVSALFYLVFRVEVCTSSDPYVCASTYPVGGMLNG